MANKTETIELRARDGSGRAVGSTSIPSIRPERKIRRYDDVANGPGEIALRRQRGGGDNIPHFHAGGCDVNAKQWSFVITPPPPTPTWKGGGRKSFRR